MTIKQIEKRLVQNGIKLDGLSLGKDRIRIEIGYKQYRDLSGRLIADCNYKKVKSMYNKLKKIFPELGNSFTNGYGAIIMNNNSGSFNPWID